MSEINFKWLTRFDFSDSFKMNDNIPEQAITTAVNDAYNYDVITTLPDALMEDIKEILLSNPKQWTKSAIYSVGDKVIYDGVYYRAAVSNDNSQPSLSNTDWEVIQLMQFWTGYVKPYFQACAYYRFFVWHGANVTQFGARQNNEDTSQEISDKRKGELLADISGKKDINLARLTKRFNDVLFTLDGIVYEYDNGDTQKPNQGVRIWGVGATARSNRYLKDRCCDDYKFDE